MSARGRLFEPVFREAIIMEHWEQSRMVVHRLQNVAKISVPMAFTISLDNIRQILARTGRQPHGIEIIRHMSHVFRPYPQALQDFGLFLRLCQKPFAWSRPID